ncbi:MAG: hypothetical protein GY842_19300 [bacterium]|nr:hypothetical protein [bacterium]
MRRTIRCTIAPTACVLAVGCTLLFAPASVTAQEAIVIDHTCTNLDMVPDCWIERAKDELRLSYGHTSHGSQIVTGLNLVNAGSNGTGATCPSCNGYGCGGCLYKVCDDYNYYKYGGSYVQAPAGVLSFWNYRPEGASDLGNPNRTEWEVATRAMLEDDRYDNRDTVMWSWCGQADTSEANMQIYLDLMSGLEEDYQNVTFVYMTGHLNGGGVEGTLNQRNNQIRDHVINTNGVLFDFADIESYDPDGDEFLSLYATDTCSYSGGGGGNWATEWCDDNPGSEMCMSCSSCAHSHCLNCNLKGRAFWWMMARLAGWTGAPSGDANCDDAVDLNDYSVFTDCLAGPDALLAPVLTDEKTCLTTFDFDDDLDVDLNDFSEFQALFDGP